MGNNELEIFQGFHIEYPEYSVTTPQTLNEFTIRSLTLSEEEKLQNSAVTVAKVAEHLTSCIWDCIVKKPDTIESYEDFLNKTSIRDREALLFALYHITYGDKQNYEVTCSNSQCGQSNSFKIDMSKIMEITPYEGEREEILNKTITVDLDTVKDTKVTLKQPTLNDEKEIYEDYLFQIKDNLEIASEVIIVERFVQLAEDGTQKEIRQPENKLKAIRSLPSQDHNKLLKEYYNEFGQYRINLKTQCVCQSCGHTDNVPIDLTQQFFRALWTGPSEEET